MHITKATRDRAAYFAGGRITTGKVGTFDKATRDFGTVHVGKIRGRIVSDEQGRWQFNSPEDARKAAAWFLAHAKKVAATSRNGSARP